MKRLKKTIFSYVMTLVLALGCATGIQIPVAAAPAPAISISSQATDRFGYQTFTVSASGAEEYSYVATVNGSEIGAGTFRSGVHTLEFWNSGSIFLQVTAPYDSDGDGYEESTQVAIGYSAQAYYVTVTCQGTDGQFLQSEQVFLDAVNYPSVTYTAPASFDLGGTVYTISNNSYLLQYGTDNVTLQYSPSTKEARSFNVYYVDESDEVIYSDAVTLNYGESYTLTAPATYETNGETYQLESRNSSYNITYDNAASEYVFEYARVIDTPETPYEITINFVDADNNNAVLYSIRQTVDVDALVHIDLPSTYEANFKQYQLAEGIDNYIEREFSSTRSTVYNIPYVVTEESVPYDVTINFVDYDNPETILSAITATVTPDGEPMTYDISSTPTLEINGVVYQVLSGQGNGNGQIVHTYGTSTRSYNVYYAAQEVNDPQPYTVTMRYISVEDNSVLDTQEVEVAYGESVEFEEAPETMTIGDTNYIRLNGQDAPIVHEYNDSQSSYAVYYRDADVETEIEVEPEVITQVVTQYVTEEDGTVVVYEDGTVAPPVAVPVTTVTDGEGNETNYNEDGQQVEIEDGNITVLEDEETPLAETPEITESEDNSGDTEPAQEDNGDTTTLEDETTPLAQLPTDGDSSNGSSVNMPLIIGGIAVVAVIIIAGAAFIIIKKKGSAK
ncbi:MAG TPA: hypothetical protein IAB46_05520 [Candidatus Scybalocola faecigallinarum]|uniref:Uncharacterized protein n=1 Tax=Candidatus Scybalocola faecigallinarum TaxID=2840941 RepID=A0A9D1JQC1_9FIRM|nr:hypothetical protein [Candidatus Scybalocola faecigallinarum]